MIKEEMLKKYALLCASCVNVASGQTVMIKCSVENYEFARLVSEACYNNGARKVYLDYYDDIKTRLDYLNMSLEDLKEIPNYIIEKEHYLVDEGFCIINIISSDPEMLKGIDITKIKERMKAINKAISFRREYTSDNKGQWSIIAVPSVPWANKVFPGDPNAYDKLWDAILKGCHIKDDTVDPIVEWNKHCKTLLERADKLNSLNLKSIHFKNGKGTDLIVNLAKEHVFSGGPEFRVSDSRMFSPNIPTEEVFGMPDKDNVNGIVYSTLPLSYQGNIINDFYLKLENGKIVDYHAQEGYETLKSIIEFDEGSNRLGEVALVPYDSAISDLKILFFETLFDENASCHLAIGDSYSQNTKNGNNLSKEELKARGANSSHTHVDFMFGSSDMSAIGETMDGKKIEILKNGNFNI